MCAFFRLLLYHILYLDYSILNCFFNCMSWLLWPMRTERRVTITVFQLGALLNRGKFCTVSYWITWMLNHLLLVQNLTSGKVKSPSSIFCVKANIVYQSTRAKNAAGIGALLWDTQGKFVLSSNAAFSWQWPHRNLCHNNGRVVSHPHLTRGLSILSLSKGLGLWTVKG